MVFTENKACTNGRANKADHSIHPLPVLNIKRSLVKIDRIAGDRTRSTRGRRLAAAIKVAQLVDAASASQIPGALLGGIVVTSSRIISIVDRQRHAVKGPRRAGARAG
ncbi:hypothetical protein EVAR_424_1 [Eumeta japonica]|uniref:Uncharacterized protein n=1 Tax=Eumeta variegata TaxID=151549 RepID=A0A4C1SAF8_EUMVA|nr:hypothetical protein EVAR_424_1 [Eumeta japonica]